MPHKNREDARQQMKAWRATPEGKASRRRSKLKHLYGISPEQYDEMVLRQGGRCAICRKKKKLHVDHDHVTDRVRELLCGPCNRAIGSLNDDPRRLQSAIDYLERHYGSQ